ncbi:MAG: amino acid ABC transporter substrate-binding protein [Saprospiraceae bacterium]|nr:amino acid ABC transporter substrate-binding protein [Saprospiraceae bacterium]
MSGSRLQVFFLIILFFGLSCGTARQSPHTSGTLDPVANNQDLPGIDPGTAKDTIVWEMETAEEFPPLTEKDDEADIPVAPGLESLTLSEYNVSVMLPFLNSRFNRISGLPDHRSQLAIQFYYGIKLALDKLSTENVNLSVNVHDTQANQSITQGLISRSSTRESHLIIGPAKGENVQMVAQFAKENGITHLSPFSASSRVTSTNPFYAQARPSLTTHCQSIIEHALERYRVDQIVLVCRDKPVERNRLPIFQEYFEANSDTLARFKEFIIGADVTGFVELDYGPYMMPEGDTTVYIVPSWSSESFVYSFLRQLRVVKGENPVVVYGMPQWQQYERGSYDYYEPLNVKVSSENYLDLNRYDVKQFQKKFFDTYGILPNEDAYKGYDLMLYAGRMMDQKGTLWQKESIPRESGMLQTEFDFQPVLTKDSTQINWYENHSVKILNFEGYSFKP